MFRKNAALTLMTLTATVALVAIVSPRTAQPLSYHNFADRREWLGIPNFGDVASNVAFAIFGVWGLWFLGPLSPDEASARFIDVRERWF
jgi:hypothetical protein